LLVQFSGATITQLIAAAVRGGRIHDRHGRL
jgi:hypothetical protein